MPALVIPATPSLSTFLKSLKQTDEIERAVENLISLLRRRQIKNSRPCAIATAHLLLRVIAAAKVKDALVLIGRVRKVGQRLVAAQPREMAVGNMVRRVLGLIREILDERDGSDTADTSEAGSVSTSQTSRRPQLSSQISSLNSFNYGAPSVNDRSLRPASRNPSQSPIDVGRGTDMANRPSIHQTATTSHMTSLFGLLSTPDRVSPAQTPISGAQSPVGVGRSLTNSRSVTNFQTESEFDVKAEVIDGIKELIDELEQVDDQIANYAPEHIHSNEIILTQTSSQTVQRFLLAAARKRKFTVIHVETFPNDHEATHDTIMRGHAKNGNNAGEEGTDRWKALTSLGINVVLIPDSAVFAIMSRVNKVILAPHTVLANGSLIAAVGATIIAQAAKVHQTPVVVLSGVYKLSPIYPFDIDDLTEYGDPGKVISFDEGDLVEKVEVINPIYDYVPSELVDLYITNLGGHAPSYLYRIVAEHYRVEDIDI